MSKATSDRLDDLDQEALRAAARLSARAVERLGELVESKNDTVALGAARTIVAISLPPDGWAWLDEPDDEVKP